MKFCIDCKYYCYEKYANYSPDRCTFSIDTGEVDLISGKKIRSNGETPCSERRSNQNDECGPDGKLFQPKHTLIYMARQKIKQLLSNKNETVQEL